MHRSLQTPTGLIATLALLATLALGVAPSAFADDWARDRTGIVTPVAAGDDWARERAAAQVIEELDPAIRAAIAARSVTPPVAAAPKAAPLAPAQGDGFAWGAAGLGLILGVAATCAALGCVTLVRHDGRLRSA
jgi:hypothetical protein